MKRWACVLLLAGCGSSGEGLFGGEDGGGEAASGPVLPEAGSGGTASDGKAGGQAMQATESGQGAEECLQEGSACTETAECCAGFGCHEGVCACAPVNPGTVTGGPACGPGWPCCQGPAPGDPVAECVPVLGAGEDTLQCVLPCREGLSVECPEGMRCLANYAVILPTCYPD